DLISEQLQTDLRLAELEYSGNELLRLKQYYESELEKLPEKQLEFARLQRDREVMNNTYSFLRQRLEESRIDIASKTGEVVIVGEAFPPDGPISPNLKKNLLLGLLSGLGMSVMLVYVMNLFDDTIRDEQFFDDHDYIILARIPFLGGSRRKSLSGSDSTNGLAKIPFIGKLGRANTADSDEVHRQESPSPSRILVTDELSSAFAESFRDLRTNLGLFHDNSKLKSLLVTGTSVSEGKSTVCANLGLSMAMLGKKVIVVDCDLRRPSQHEFFYASKNPGVSDFLAGDVDSIGDADVQSTGYESLFILPAGSPVSNPNELLYSSRMPKLIEELKKHYDLVLLDSPPMLLLSDAAVLSQSVDGVLLTGRMRYSSKKHFKELKKLVFLKENLLGV
ncbi:MAG: polysaccharide biosynthesis tyrosine autokinase, partial [Candidatus Omnitrophica bacterium]|nr:polysaccharide biosynthesis tyrosine autokinase [Candidatus Omnitrophota bacterium]